MAKFRKGPVVVDAEQATKGLVIHTLEGHVIAQPGDWIITGVKGERYLCKSDIFEATYEAVGDGQSGQGKERDICQTIQERLDQPRPGEMCPKCHVGIMRTGPGKPLHVWQCSNQNECGYREQILTGLRRLAVQAKEENERLPKTADGVTVVPGDMELWAIGTGVSAGRIYLWCKKVLAVSRTSAMCVAGGLFQRTEYFYSTRAAAQAAKELQT